MNQWKEGILEELAVFQRGHDLPKSEMKSGVIPVAGSNGIIGYHNTATTKGPGITIGRSGNIGTPHFYKTDFWAHNTVLYVKDFKGNDESYVFYFLHTFDFAGFNAGSAVPTLNRNHIHELSIKIPPLPEQRAIASVLSSLDDKIDLLHRQNKTIEALAETLFRKMFIEDAPQPSPRPSPSGRGSEEEEADEGWEEGKLGDLVNVKYGKDHKKLVDGIIPVFGSGGIMRYADTSLYNEESVLIPRKGTLNNIIFIDEPFWTVDTMFYTEMKKPNIAKFIYHLTKDIDFAGMNVGSAVPSMTTEVLNNLPINIPPDSLIQEFDNAVNDLYKKKKANTIQNNTLSKLRDTLLPKLMSGEVRVECS